MHWLLDESTFVGEESTKIHTALDRMGLPYSDHKVVPFIGELIPPAAPTQSKVICIGRYSMRLTAKKYSWNPGVYDLFDYDFRLQRSHWGDQMLNADSLVVPFKDAVIEEPTFIRPCDDTKYFTGRVWEAEEFNTWRKGICEGGNDWGNGLSGETLLQLCRPKVIYAEYRYWIVDGRIVTRSLYKRGSKVIYSTEVDQAVDWYARGVGCATTLAARNPLPWLPKAFVLDVCETPDGYKIVEINTINCAGFYAGDVQLIVAALEELER